MLFRLHIFDLLAQYGLLLQKFSLGVFFAVIVLAIRKFVEVLIHKKSSGKYTGYNVIHLTHLISIILVTIIMISLLFTNLYAAAVSIGIDLAHFAVQILKPDSFFYSLYKWPGFCFKIIRQITTAELGPEMLDRIKQLKETVKGTSENELEIKKYPFVTFSINNNTWVEVSVTYLVPPRKACRYRTTIIHKILLELNKSPEKVLFPKGDSR